MWKYKGVELGLEGITGIPATDMTDEEFAQAEGKLAAQFPDQLGALARSGLWVKEEEEEEKPKTTSVSAKKTEVSIEVTKSASADKPEGEGDSNG